MVVAYSGGRDRMISVSSRPAWSREQVLGRLQSYKETLSPKKERKKEKEIKVKLRDKNRPRTISNSELPQ